MFNTKIGNPKSILRLEKWVEKPSTSILLTGKRGLPLKELAKEVASKLLGEEILTKSPDYLYVEPTDGKIGVEDINEVIKKASFSPVKGKHVVLIDQMDKATIQGQNKLLKTIEDASNMVVIMTATTDNILETIKSRVLTLKFNPLTEEEFYEVYKGEEKILAFALSQGCPNAVNDEMVDFYKPIIECIALNEEKELLKLLHLFKEKDEESFFLTRKGEIPMLLNILEYSYMDVLRYITLEEVGKLCQPQVLREESELYAKLELINLEKKAISRVSYTKDDFFLFIISLI